MTFIYEQTAVSNIYYPVGRKYCTTGFQHPRISKKGKKHTFRQRACNICSYMKKSGENKKRDLENWPEDTNATRAEDYTHLFLLFFITQLYISRL